MSAARHPCRRRKDGSCRYRLRAEPARHREAVWQELRRLGAVAIGQTMLRGRDVLATAAAHAADQDLKACAAKLEDYTTLWVPITHPAHATWAYSWITPPSRSSRRTRTLVGGTGSGTAPSGAA